ncbi:SAM-dependent methyltransferase [Spiractinospora alimapuensis]|uniref:TRM11 family SAM-dependent methyltransferase n=1 Tax=Spiractinospora alimapuensis TaxID=2820884 RepID=UPI001F1F14AA|nr:SAM-dependent methyltransferase [Spiractinospora alimapuensis]QVQ53653.1 SAM-dependent methyltransferase [Spiractinospora alimapuensis]
MPSYAMLVLPAANRVYADSAPALMAAELAVFGGAVLAGRLTNIRPTEIAGVPYVAFDADDLTREDLDLLANVSSVYAMFRVDGTGATDGAPMLTPVRLRRMDRFDDDLLTIPKYTGKTNEHFTKLLLNVTVLGSDCAAEMTRRKLHVLDPLCGRGTTLNQAMMYGYDASGVDLDKRDFEAYEAFIKTWMKRKRLKHTAERVTVRRSKQTLGRRLDIEVAPSKEQYKAGETQLVAMVNADTTTVGEFFRPRSFDVIVADAPYGVQHGSRTAQRGLRRDPVELVAAAAPAWVETLRPGGALGLSFNTHVASWDDLAVELTEAGLEVILDDAYRAFEHRVDQAISRDLIVARKPR